MLKKQDNYQHILSIAEYFMQTCGYNAFSFHDIAKEVGIKTASIHYYFPTKADLGKAVVKKHIDELSKTLEDLIANNRLASIKKMEVFIDTIVASTYASDRKMCLGGMLASDVLTLPEDMQYEVRIFFNRIEAWIKKVLLEGIQKKEFVIEKKRVNTEVMLILSLLEGALLLSRLFQDNGHLVAARKMLLARLTKD